MCGIAGVMFYGERARHAAAPVVRRMLDALHHRGPDGEGIWQGPDSQLQAIALAHARLAIIDLSDAGRQPMTRGRLTVTYNGEIYNYRALRAELEAKGHSFRTQSDTEVLLAAVEEWGLDAPSRLDGMFAAGIWDAASNRLTLFRDRLGIKPLYFTDGGGFLAFASEVRALMASGLVEPRLDESSLWHYLGYQTTPTPATLLKGIRMLEPGHVLVAGGRGQTTQRRYWDLLQRSTGQPDVSAAVARDRVRELLHDAVTSHIVSDVPVGVFLSSGLDSGALVSTLRSAGADARTFTIALTDAACDESSLARQVAARYGADHTELHLTESRLLDMLPDVLDAVDHPSGDGVNTFVVSKLVRDHGVKVALSGLGGDEVFGGYPSFRRLARVLPAAGQFGRSPAGVRRLAAGVVRAVGGGSVTASKAAAVIEGDGSLAAVWPVTRQLFSVHERRRMLAPAWQPPAGAADSYEPLLSEAYARTPEAHLWSRVSYAESRAYMHDVLLRDTDQMSMAHGLEVRVPLLDHRLVEFVAGLPDHVKSDGDRAKPLLVDSLRDPLPTEVTSRPKRGFTLPFEQWMRGALRPFCEAQLGDRGLDGRELFQPGEVTKLWRGFLDGAPGLTWSRLWTLVALNAWMDKHHVSGGRP